ncbi:hypothetical protein, partial [Prevotellamassilia timonensis]|uniref:hypothetical protein n=1 Tax=Prevotellamassilia timonensis TaxID=1852370 RepID=UPI00307FE8A6
NAHKIRQIRHLRGAKARCVSERIRAIGAIREHSMLHSASSFFVSSNATCGSPLAYSYKFKLTMA